MPLHEPVIDELGMWVPRSGYFQHYYRKARAKAMVQQQPREHGAVLAFCPFCQQAYLKSDAVTVSPCHEMEGELAYNLEDLFDSVNILAELVRDRVAGATDQPSQEPSTASEGATSESEQVRPAFMPDASVEGSKEPPQDRAPDGGSPEPAPAAPVPAKPAPARARQPRKPQPAAAAAS